MNQSETASPPATIIIPTKYMEQGWQFESKDTTVKAQNYSEKYRICTVVLSRKDEQEQDTYNRVFNEIDKHYKIEN